MQYEKKLSICMIIKNEEKNLNRCLNSVQPIINAGLGEIIVIDTGSNDNSLEILKQYTTNVHKGTWNNDFSEMRNKSLDYAKGEWILIMDADEEIENPEEFIIFLKKDLTKYNTMTISMKNYTNLGKSSYSNNTLFRLFRNDGEFKYKGEIHEQPICKSPVFSSNLILGHYGYLWEDEGLKIRKFERTSKILEKELKKDPKNIYYRFQYAVCYLKKDIKVGLTEIRKVYKLIEKCSYRNKMKYSYVYGMYAKIAYMNNKYGETIKICEEGLNLLKDYIDLWYILGMTYQKINDEENSLNILNSFLKCRNGFYKTELSKNTAFTFYHLGEESKEDAIYCIALIYLNRKNYSKALEYTKKLSISTQKSKLIINIGKEVGIEPVITDYINEIKDNEKEMKEFINLLECLNFKDDKRKYLINKMIDFYTENNKQNYCYYFLNIVRKSIEENQKINALDLDCISKINYNEVEDYYGDIVFYIIKNNFQLSILKNIGEIVNFERFINYIRNKYENIDNQVISYLYKNEFNIENSNLKYWISLARNILIADNIEEDAYEKLFKKYVDNGIKYIHIIYNSELLKEEMIYDVNNMEHRFFFYLEKANNIKVKDKREYIGYLKKALKIFPMGKGIKILIERLNEEDIVNKNSSKNQFEEYRKMVKNNISILISKGKFNDVKMIIDEYLKIDPKDLEMLTLKSDVLVKYLN